MNACLPTPQNKNKIGYWVLAGYRRQLNLLVIVSSVSVNLFFNYILICTQIIFVNVISASLTRIDPQLIAYTTMFLYELMYCKDVYQ